MNRSVLALKAAAVLLLFAFLSWAQFVLPVLPFGSWLFVGLGFALPMAMMFGLILAGVSLPSILRGNAPASNVRDLALGFAIFAGAVLGLWFGPSHRMARIAQVTDASMPLVRAIEEFEREQNRPPHQLRELVPKYLSEVPATGMGAHPDWEYHIGKEAQRYGDNSWVLLVRTPGPGVSFDLLMYFPNQKYPASGYGGGIERVGLWGYVHE